MCREIARLQRTKKLLVFVSGAFLLSTLKNVQEIARLQRTKKLLVFVSGAFLISSIKMCRR
jgi:hypothetical protein